MCFDLYSHFKYGCCTDISLVLVKINLKISTESVVNLPLFDPELTSDLHTLERSFDKNTYKKFKGYPWG